VEGDLIMTSDTNFRATGPGVGFDARADQNDGLSIGVRGVGSSSYLPDIEQTVGVVGYTATLDGSISNGTGVRGVTAGGTGVKGLSTDGGVGVEGRAGGPGTGVRGRSEDGGNGVAGESAQGVGVFGFGGRIGVEGASDGVGVLGGPPVGPVFAPGQVPPGIGVLGNGIGDVRTGDLPLAYGGWFDAINGTAPMHLEPSREVAPPAAALRGDIFVGSAGTLWFCTDSGDGDANPATWRQIQLV
jgi:hypothetical protein